MAASEELRAKSPTRVPGGMRGSLFARIYLSFVLTVLIFAVLVGALVFAATSRWNEERVGELIDRIGESGTPLARALVNEDQPALLAELDALGEDIDAHVSVYPHKRGRRFDAPLSVGPGRAPPARQLLTHMDKRDHHRLRRGQPIVHRHGLAPPTIALALFERGFYADAETDIDIDIEERGLEFNAALEQASRDAKTGRFIAMVVLEPRANPLRLVLGFGVLLLAALAGGAWPLARSLTSRLAKLERSTEALARGELSHRAETAEEARDEVDRLALSFNEMADRLETLVTGQKTLLANVSHELRTPIARSKVLVEILGARLESMREAKTQREPIDEADIARLERGLVEMTEDLGEVEELIKDLLTSGRLELGREGILNLELIELGELCEDTATRFDARVERVGEGPLELHADRLLLERLLKNLLANARRACPEDDICIRVARDGQEEGTLIIEVEDEGPGIPADKRTQIFEPFARLDAARARDQGGVGLGLYLCRQIAGAHGGSIHASDRLDGGSGARFVIRLASCNPTSKPSSSSSSATK